MTKPWTILAPITMQPSGTRAIGHALEVANRMSAQLILLHVVPPADTRRGGGRMPAWPQAALADAAGFGLRRVTLCGEPAATICQYAESVNANLIVVAPGARSMWWPGRGRAVISRLLASTPRPVHIWSPRAAHDAPPFRCRRLLCMLELDGNDGPLIEAARQVAERTGADLEVSHVVPEPTEALLYCSTGHPDRPLSISVAAKRLRELLPLLPPAVTTSIVVGDRRKWIARNARRTSADVILIGRAGASSWFGASEPAAISRAAGCPVISVSLRDPPPGTPFASAHRRSDEGYITHLPVYSAADRESSRDAGC